MPLYLIVEPDLIQESMDLLNRFGSPTAARAKLVNRTINWLIQSNAWAKLDMLHVLAAPNGTALLQNWKQNAYNLTVNGTITPEVDRGATSDASTGFYSTGYDPSALPPGLLMQQNSAHIGAFVSAVSANTGWDIGAVGNRAKVRGSSTPTGGISTTSAVAGVAATGPERISSIRRDGANNLLFQNGRQVATAPNASAGLCGAIEYFRANGLAPYSTRQVQLGHAGSAFTDAEAAAFDDIMCQYLRDIGAAV